MKLQPNNVILSHTDVVNKLRRMAYQIYESHANETDIILAGIDKNGYRLAEELQLILEQISTLNVLLCKVTINKKEPLTPVQTSLSETKYANKAIVLIDDVLNSGTTLIYGVKHFLNVPLKQFKTAVLINRNHKKYPIKADFKGLSLSTTLQEHVKVTLKANNFKAILE